MLLNGVTNNVRGYSAIKSGLFPLVKNRRTIDKRLDGVIVTGTEKEYCSILTSEEEDSRNLVFFVFCMKLGESWGIFRK